MPVVRDTIHDILKIFQANLESALNGLQTLPQDAARDNVIIGNIAFAETPGNRSPSINDRLVLTVIKIEEEFTLKNQPAHRRNPVNGNLEYINPPAVLNLYVLLTANNNAYDKALLFLSRSIGYLQHQRVFTEENSVPVSGLGITRFNFNINLYSPSFEQINHIWGVLGGKQLPSVIYKLQLVSIQYEDEPQAGDEIRTIILGETIY
ncbi:MAG: DUF4255 domain-containing protein [Phaeodactylibacter sp.]|nr:DUF4255 domain-containing protein [Phaeodactylibacter sp.]MCB9049779.1 DUF4255 domain-containing protein [Lewinellaceae bacterium]